MRLIGLQALLPRRWRAQRSRADGADVLPDEATTLARRSGLNFVGLATFNTLQFLLLLVLSRSLGQHEAGVFFEGLAALKLLTVLASVGLEVTVVRYVAQHRARGEFAEARAAVRLSLRLAGTASVLAAAGTFVVAPKVADVFGTPELEFVLRVMVLSLPATVLQLVLIGATRGTGRMTPFVLVDQVLDGSIRVVAIAAALGLGYGLHGLAVAYALPSVIPLAAAAFAARRLVLGPQAAEAVPVSGLIRFTGYQWAALMASVGLVWIDALLLGLWRPPADVAVYAVATRTVLLGTVFILPIGIAFQPVIARLLALNERERLRSMYAIATKWSTIMGGAPVLFAALFAAPILTVLYGDSYARGAWPLALLALAQVVNAATGPCGHIVAMSGRADLVFYNSVAALILNIVLNIVLIPPYGMVGAGLAWALSIAAWNLLRLWQVWRILHMHPFLGWPGRVGAALLLFATAAALARASFDFAAMWAELLAAIALSGVVYAVALSTLRVVDAEDTWLPDRIVQLARGQRSSM